MAAPASTGKPKMLVIDDDPVWQTTIKTKFSKRFDVVAYTTAEEALRNLHTRPEVIILDHHLYADQNPAYQEGKNVLPLILKQLPHTPVIMLSAQEDIQTAVDVLNGGAYDYVAKQADTWAERLNIVLRNIQNAKNLQSEVLRLQLSIGRSKLAVILLSAFIVLMVIGIYLYQCPSLRVIKWDPLNRANSGQCLVPGVGTAVD